MGSNQNGGGQPPAESATKVRRKSTRNLFLRMASALAVLGMTYYCLWYDLANGTGWAFAALLTVMGILCLREFYRFAVHCGILPFRVLGLILGPLWILATEWDLSGSRAAFFAIDASFVVFMLVVIGSMLLQLTRKTNDSSMNNVATTVFGMVYCCMLPGFFVHMRHMAFGPEGWPAHGMEFAVVCIFVCKVADVGALLTGSMWGRHKMIPRLSPGKTWEGALGGLMFSVLLLQFMVYMTPAMALARLGFFKQLALSVLLAVGGMGGDLVESSFKRNSRQKDAGTGVPGFGGILDMTDSLMVAAPVMYFFLVACGATYVKG